MQTSVFFKKIECGMYKFDANFTHTCTVRYTLMLCLFVPGKYTVVREHLHPIIQ